MNNDHIKYKKRKYKGFSFMESMLSVFVLATGVVAATGLLSTTIAHTYDSRDQVMASSLAEEGIELVRSIRDNNWMSGAESFDHGLNVSSNNCRIDPTYTDLNCSGASNNLFINGSGFYVHAGGSATKFKRRILNSGDAQSRTITSMVVWGNDFPSYDNCDTSHKCAAARVIFQKWGEK